MRKLTQREKILLAIVAVVVVVALFMAVEPVVRQGFSGGELAVAREKLQTAQDLVQLAQTAEKIDGKLRHQVGLQGRIISDSLFQEVSDRVALTDLNRARRAADLAALLPALEGKADSLLAYKKQQGEFENFDALKKIQGPIFEGEQPQAVISRRIANLVQKSGLKPNYQLNIKPMSGKKSEKLSTSAKKNLLDYLYLSELDEELQQLEAQQKAIEEKAETTKEAVMDAMFDAWWSDDDNDGDEKEGPKSESDEQLVKGKIAGNSDSESDMKHRPAPAQDLNREGVKQKPNRQFAPLPETIPLALRIQLIQFIQANLKGQMAGAVKFKKGFLDDQILIERTKAQGGFLGLGAKKQTEQAKFNPNSILLSKFEALINRYEDEQAYDLPEGSAADTLDYDPQLRALAEYVDGILKQKKALHDRLAKVPSTYQPETYIVEMNFRGEIDKVVRLIQSIESNLKWLQVRDLKISVADKKKTTLGVNLSMTAEVL
ncbi:MAG: hypothetical protein O7E52_12230 [Candidatus Poribacteria bacterium]|nr:hypothetical protein [Candidatus Poribacteria bacterium]